MWERKRNSDKESTKFGKKYTKIKEKFMQIRQKITSVIEKIRPMGYNKIVKEAKKSKDKELIRMASVFDVAKYILEKKGKMSTWKLQKLCYYSQAWSLAWISKPIFNEDFEAWSNGPVCPELFSAHKGKFAVSSSEISGNSSNLSCDEKDMINIVLRDYGTMEPYDLRELSHSEDPWINARHGLPDGAPSNVVITKDAMGDYYGSL